MSVITLGGHAPQVNPRPPDPLSEVMRVRLIGHIEGQTTANVFYYYLNQIIGNGKRTHQDALHALLTETNGFMHAYYSAISADWTSTTIYIDSPTNGSLAPVPYGEVLKGGMGPVGHCPTQSAVVINKLTTWKGKHGRGRISVPGVPLTWVTGTTLSTVSNHQFLASFMLTVLNDATNTFTPVVYGQTRKLDPSPGYWAQPLADCTVNPILGSIRRRRPGVGK